MNTQEMAAAAEAMSQESKAMDTHPEALSGQSHTMGAARDRRERDRMSPRAQILSQEREIHDEDFDGNQKNELRERNYADEHEEGQNLDQTQDVNSTFMEQHHSKMNNEPNEAIDKDQFVEIISCAFDKIISSLHPRIGDSLN